MMNIAFLGAVKDLKEEKFEQALLAMQEVAVNSTLKKALALKPAHPYRVSKQIYLSSDINI